MTYHECKEIAELDLEPIKAKLMHEESGEGWTLEQTNAVEAEYRRFLYLMKMYPHEAAAPLMDVDIFWHYHILDTMKYAQDCEVVFGYFLHHFPYVGLRGEDDLAAHEQMGDRMRELYEETFGEKYRFQHAHPEAAGSSSGPGIAYSAAPAGQENGIILSTAYSAAPAIAYSAAPSRQHKDAMLDTAYSAAPAVAYSAAPSRPHNEALLATAYSAAPAVAYSAAPARPAQAVAYSAAPSRQVNGKRLANAYSAAPAIAYSAAPAHSAGRDEPGMKKLGPAMAEFFSIRPRLESPAFA